jgi:hypothetical protein
LNGAEKTHGIFNRRQRKQVDGSEVPGSLSHRIYFDTVSLHGVGDERPHGDRQTFCCLHSALAVFFPANAGWLCCAWVSSILTAGILNQIVMEAQIEVVLGLDNPVEKARLQPQNRRIGIVGVT